VLFRGSFSNEAPSLTCARQQSRSSALAVCAIATGTDCIRRQHQRSQPKSGRGCRNRTDPQSCTANAAELMFLPELQEDGGRTTSSHRVGLPYFEIQPPHAYAVWLRHAHCIEGRAEIDMKPLSTTRRYMGHHVCGGGVASPRPAPQTSGKL
jgi:hypothetical protein